MRIFITGGSGFLGRNTIKKLISSGHEVSALARSKSSEKIVSELGAKVISGDIEDIESYQSVFREVDVVVHCAAPMEFWGPWENFDKQIVQATTKLAEKASEYGVKRFIHISSESVVQDEAPLVDINESFPYPEIPNSFYGLAKKNAELKLLALDTKMEIIILRPTFIYGQGCPAVDTILKKAKSGQFMWIDQGTAEFEAVHVENVANAILCSLDHGKSKSIYYITDGKKQTVREFFEKLFNDHKVKSPKTSVPLSVVAPVARLLEWTWLKLKIKSAPPLSRFELAFISQPRRYDISKAKSELGYSPQLFNS